MSDFEAIQKWIAEKTFNSPDCRNNKIEIGGLDFSMLLQRDTTGKTNPLEITLQSDHNQTSRALFSMPSKNEQATVLGSIKKISCTPFYHSYLSSPFFIADIIDFYDWGKDTQLYRIFLIQHQESNITIHISFPNSESPVPLRKNVFQTGNLYWFAQPDLQLENRENGLILKTRFDPKQKAVLAVTISLSDNPAGGDSQIPIYKVLKSLTELAGQHHIKNNYFINDRAVQSEIDDLWTQQKAITPDWNIAGSILNNLLRYQLVLTWAIELALYFNNWNLIKEIYQALQQNSNTVNNSSRLLFLDARLNKLLGAEATKHFVPATEFDAVDPFRACMENSAQAGPNIGELSEEQNLYRSYFSSSEGGDITTDMLQRYWNRLSLPLFESKLERELKANPEKIIILYLLGLYYGLPYAKILAGKIEEKVAEPVLRLFILLQQQIQKRSLTDSSFNFKDGCQQNYTGKTLNLFDQSSLRFSRFGKRFYVQYLSADKFRFRIDKKINCFVDYGHHQISVYPDVPFYPHHVPADKRMEIQSSGYTVSWPFLWPKAEVLCTGLRFRWIFKKRRYQITVQKKKNCPDLSIAGQVIDWPANKKMIHYYEVKNTIPEMLIKVWDMQGREMHLQPICGSSRHIQLAGWLKNRYNQFADHLNFKPGPRQHCISGTSQNGIQSMLSIPATIQAVTFGIKGMQQIVNLSYCSDPFWEKLYHYSIKLGHGLLVVLIDDSIKEQYPFIQNFFNEYFAFQPKYFFTKPNNLPINCSILIYISGTAEGITVQRDKKYTMAPYLVVGVKQGIEQLKRFSNSIEQNLVKGNTVSIKRLGKA